MHGIVIAPKFYENNAWKSEALYNKLCKKYNFSYICTDSPNLDGYDVAIIQSVPYHNRPAIPPGLLDAKCKLIGEFGDLQCWDNEECIKNKEILFNRYDLLVGAYYERMEEWYPHYLYKYIHWPQYFAPYERYSCLSINPNSRMRCLLIGSYGGHAYPLRQHIVNSRNQYPNNGYVDVVGPWQIPFSQYPKYLNNYFCSLVFPGVNNVPVAKYFEVPAAGVLLLAKEIKELTICGFKPNVHYVPVTRDNVFDKIKSVLANPNAYVKIRAEGVEFVRRNHSDVNRVGAFREIFDRLWPNGHMLRRN